MSKKTLQVSYLKNSVWIHCVAIVNLFLFYYANDLITDNNTSARLLFLLAAVVSVFVIIGEIRLAILGEKKQMLVAIPLIILNLIIGGYSLLAAALLGL